MNIVVFILWGWMKILDKWGVWGMIGILAVLALLGAQ